MTRDEVKKLVMAIVYTYPNFKPQDLRVMVYIWHEMLADYDYGVCVSGLKAYIATDTSGFAPSIGQLIDKVHVISNPAEMNEMEAWALVSKAIRNGYYGAEKEFEKLPPIVQKAVGSASLLRQWATTDAESIENVIQSNFLKNLRIVKNREKDFQKLPACVRLLIEKTVDGKERREHERLIQHK